MSVYKISVKDPNSDNERNITGEIIFKTLGPKYTAVATVKGLPKPFTTTSTYVVNGKTALEIASLGEFTVEGDEGFAEHISDLVDEIVEDIVDVIGNIYNVDLGTRVVTENITQEPITQTSNPTASTPNNGSGTSSTPINTATASTPKDSIFTFNVERDGIFIPISSNTNDIPSNIGELVLVDESNSFIFQDDFESLDELDPEFLETDFDGLDEQEFVLQDEISNNINDQEQSENLQDTDTGEVVDIKPVSSFDELLRLAGKLARTLGKNARVKYENLNKGYTKGIHGLCPQGTQAVLYALTGIKDLGKISGNADWFSFKSPGTGGGNASFSKTGHYKDKVRITQKNGSWKGTYIQDPNQWQIGDIIVMGYTGGKKYGHIQIWTGVKWMSDFKQNAIQQNHVDPNTVALWRLSEKGIAAVKAQSGNIGGTLS